MEGGGRDWENHINLILDSASPGRFINQGEHLSVRAQFNPGDDVILRKVRVILQQAMEAVSWSRGAALLFP